MLSGAVFGTEQAGGKPEARTRQGVWLKQPDEQWCKQEACCMLFVAVAALKQMLAWPQA